MLAGDEQARRATARVVNAHARLGIHDEGHDPGDFRGREELAGRLAAALGELADQVLVAAADDVGLDVRQPQPLLADPLDEVRKPVVIDVALAVGRGVEVHAVDDAFKRGVGPGDVVQVARQAFANLTGQLADDGPDRHVGILRLQGQAEANKLVIPLDQLERFSARADFRGDAVELVVEDVAQPFGENQRQDEVLELRRLLRPADAASGVPNPGLERLVAGVVHDPSVTRMGRAEPVLERLRSGL